jgi:hypothetical protein
MACVPLGDPDGDRIQRVRNGSRDDIFSHEQPLDREMPYPRLAGNGLGRMCSEGPDGFFRFLSLKCEQPVAFVGGNGSGSALIISFIFCHEGRPNEQRDLRRSRPPQTSPRMQPLWGSMSRLSR